MENVFAIPKARIPVVKFVFPDTGMGWLLGHHLARFTRAVRAGGRIDWARSRVSGRDGPVAVAAGRAGTKADITVNNMLATVNTKLLRDYAAIDPRLRQLVSRSNHLLLAAREGHQLGAAFAPLGHAHCLPPHI